MSIAVFGGSFNPLHIGHIKLIEKVKEEFGFDNIVLLPSNNPPHKIGKGDIPFEIKIEMLNELVGRDISLCTIEGESNKVHYTADTIVELKKIYGDFTFIMGGDSMLNFHSWKNPDFIARSVPIIVGARGNFNIEKEVDKYNNSGGKITVFDFDCDVSSQRIRALYELKMSADGLVTEKTDQIIKKYKLYHCYRKEVEEVRKRINSDRFKHTCSVVLTALKLNEQAGLSFEKVFLSSLLHDVAKNEKTARYLVPEGTENTEVMHAFLGAEIAEREFKINDKEILDAIRFHTTARENMTALDKIVYLADMIEENRKFDGVDNLRKISFSDYDKGFKKAIERSYEYLLGKGKDIYYLTKSAYDRYVNN